MRSGLPRGSNASQPTLNWKALQATTKQLLLFGEIPRRVGPEESRARESRMSRESSVLAKKIDTEQPGSSHNNEQRTG